MAGDDTSPGLLPSGSEKVGGSRSNLLGGACERHTKWPPDFHFSIYILLQKHGGI